VNPPADGCNDPPEMRLITAAAVVTAALLGGSLPVAADDLVTARVARRADLLARRAAFFLDEARVEADARRARCHDRVLSQTNAVIRMVHHRVEQMETASPPERVHHEYVMGVVERRLDELEADLHACNGERYTTSRPGTLVIVTISPNVPREDPTVFRETRRHAFPLVPSR